jgi:hypothetical protein
MYYYDDLKIFKVIKKNTIIQLYILPQIKYKKENNNNNNE